MFNCQQFRDLVVRPTLAIMRSAETRLDTQAACELLMGTMVHESTIDGETYLRQKPDGRALGVYQVEPETHKWMWDWLAAPGRAQWRSVFSQLGAQTRHDELLITNLAYATAVARWRYWVAPAALPPHQDVDGMSRYWGARYQTQSIPESMAHWAAGYHRHCLPIS